MGAAVGRLLENWTAVQAFVAAEREDKNSHVKLLRLEELFNRPSRKLYFLFLKFVLPVSNFVTVLLNDVLIIKMKRITH